MRAIWIIALACAACGGKSAGAASVKEADNDTDLTDCTFLQKVEGAASESDSHAEAHAKADARAKAAALGATHVKWIIPCCTSVEAEAYHCDQPTD